VQDVTDDATTADAATAEPATDAAPGRAGALAETLRAMAATEAEAQAEARAAATWFTGVAATTAHDPAKAADARPVLPRWRHRYTKLLVLCDVLAVVVAMDVAASLSSPRPQAWLVAVATVAVVGAIWANRAYEHRFLGHGTDEFWRLWTGCVSLVAAASLAAYAFRLEQVRGLLLVGTPLAVAGLLGVHLAARIGLYRMRRRHRCVQKCVAIGSERSVAELVRATRADTRAGLEIVGACVARSQGPVVDGVPVLGTPADAAGAVRVARADTVILTAWSDVAQEDLRRLAWHLEGTRTQILVAPRLAEVSAPRMHIRTVQGRPLLNVENPDLGPWRRKVKRFMDLALTVPGLFFLAPVLAVLALLVKRSSPGPVLFRQERVGEQGETFPMTKFRSMYVDAEERLAQLEHLNEHGGGPLFKMKDDPRITPVGRWLRRFSLDELPQLLDVWRGDMSLVGPRPPLPREVSQYDQDVRRRLRVKPGITGLWQVSGRSDLSWEESVRLDTSYVENWSVWLDVTIILRTVVAVLRRSGAY
jgi:exopolysaccharide biosynthesis polyprenyl glycosylphosphotransferase